MLAGIAVAAALLLYLLDRPTRKILGDAERGRGDDLTDVPEGLGRPEHV
jgi:hypothetical protein